MSQIPHLRRSSEKRLSEVALVENEMLNVQLSTRSTSNVQHWQVVIER